jgi:hypothetical protein
LLRDTFTRFNTAPRMRGLPAVSVSIARSARRRRVISEPTTNATPETHCVRIDASVTANTGGVSMITHSNGPACTWAISVSIRPEPRSSDGFGGVEPAGITQRSGSTRR